MFKSSVNNDPDDQIMTSNHKIQSDITKHILRHSTWYDADLLLEQIDMNQASANRTAILIRRKIQSYFYQLGLFIQHNAGLVLFVGVLLLIASITGIKSVGFENNIENLWVEKGGRIEREVEYVKKTLGDGFGNTNQILIQTPKNDHSSVLEPSSLLMHLEVMKIATQVNVELFDISWKLKDICYSLNPPDIEEYNVFQVIEKLIPCAIITPLDCFWEGSKILGPEDDLQLPGFGPMRWTSLNPKKLIDNLQNNLPMISRSSDSFSTNGFIEILKRGGISSAYQDKYCLDPLDEECPSTAPNKHSSDPPDVGAVLTGGCYGFATKWMHWPEALVVGGFLKNRTGHIVKAGALQSIIQLMSDQDLFEYYLNHFKVISIDWTLEKARLVLETWQRKLSEEIQQFQKLQSDSFGYNVHQFTSVTLEDIMKNFNSFQLDKVGITGGMLLIYCLLVLFTSQKFRKSHFALAVQWVALAMLSTMAGFGFCALIGLKFNANTTQIAPYIALGCSFLQLFWLLQTYHENLAFKLDNDDIIGRCLQQTGFSILLSSLCVVGSFAAASVMPIPALRNFVFQATILLGYSIFVVFIMFPAILTIHHRQTYIEPSSPYRTNEKKHKEISPKKREALFTKSYTENMQQTEKRNPDDELCYQFNLCPNNSLRGFVRYIYAPLLAQKGVKLIALLSYLAFTIYCMLGVSKVKDGLDLTDIVPRKTDEYQFLAAQKDHFSVFHMFVVTKRNFDYANNQRMLYDFHASFSRVNALVKDDNGALPEFWLHMFRDWLKGLQAAYDTDVDRHAIFEEGWHKNASADGILAFKLLVQTGRIDVPVDRRLIAKKKRLVDDNDIINPKAFYNYLSAWVSNDALTYSASQAVFRPEPKQWTHDPSDFDLRIPKAQPLVYAQMPFLLSGLDTTDAIVQAIQEIRAICSKFEERGLHTFPSGLPFVFWEQYIRLRVFFALGTGIALGITLFMFIILMANVWAGLLLTIVLALMHMQLFGIMGHLNISLNAVPAVILILSLGVGASNLMHISIIYLTSMSKHNDRMKSTLEHVFAPLFHGLVSVSIGVAMLCYSEFDFIYKYFFNVLCCAIALNCVTSFCFYPILLTVLGSRCEVYSLNSDLFSKKPSELLNQKQNRTKCAKSVHAMYKGFKNRRNRVAEPEEQTATTNSTHNTNSNFRKVYPRVHSEISLSTISEEPQDYASSREIIVHPQLILEATTTSTPVNSFYPPYCRPQTSCNTPNGDRNRTPSCCTTPAAGTCTPSSTDRDTPESGRDTSCAFSSTNERCESASSYSRCSPASVCHNYPHDAPVHYPHHRTPPPSYQSAEANYTNSFTTTEYATAGDRSPYYGCDHQLPARPPAPPPPPRRSTLSSTSNNSGTSPNMCGNTHPSGYTEQNYSPSPSCSYTCSGHLPQTVTTKVTATAKLKVELHPSREPRTRSRDTHRNSFNRHH